MSDPFFKAQKLVWRIRNPAARRVATIGLFGLINAPLHALFWLAVPAFWALFILIGAAKGALEQIFDSWHVTIGTALAWPGDMREKRRVFGVLWRESEAEWRERRGQP